MWCRDCHKEVDVKTAGMAGAACPLCSRPLVASTRQTDDIRRAYEILERWQSSDLFERISTTAPLTTLKQQDRAPLLNIPLGKPTPAPAAVVSVSAPADAPLSTSEKSGRTHSRTARVERSSMPWESLSPPMSPASLSSGLPHITRPASPAVKHAGVNTSADQVLWELLVAPRPLLAAAAPDLETAPAAAVEVTPALLSGVSERRPPEETKAESPAASDESLHIYAAAGSAEPESAAADSQADLSTAEWAESAGAETLPFRKADGRDIAGGLTTPLEILQSASPLPVSSASIRVESAEEHANSHNSVNDINPPGADGTKKKQRAALRRSPLHRRFQSEHPVSESSAGPDTVTRKLRLDQTGANAEISQAKEPVTSLPSSTVPETKIVSNSPKPGRRFRVDSAESLDSVTSTDGRRVRTGGLPRRRFIDEAHESQLRGPHFEVSTPRRTNLTSMTGQFLAYLGVLGLTVGTAMVIYGHFGGYSEYTPTGWLVTTVAQMLLFLGVINLVSGGIEQNNEDVSRRINTIGEQLLRIEQVTSNAMKGPKLPSHLYADDAEAQETTTRETVTIHRS